METSVPLKNPFFANIEPRFEAFKEKMCKLAHKNKVDFDEKRIAYLQMIESIIDRMSNKSGNIKT